MKYRKIILITASLFLVSLAILLINPKTAKTPVSAQQIEKTYSLDDLKNYDGSIDGQQILLALDGLVYDVSAGKEFYGAKGPYHYLAGKDSSTELHLAGGDIIKRKYPVVGRLQQ